MMPGSLRFAWPRGHSILPHSLDSNSTKCTQEACFRRGKLTTNSTAGPTPIEAAIDDGLHNHFQAARARHIVDYRSNRLAGIALPASIIVVRCALVVVVPHRRALPEFTPVGAFL